MGDIPNLDGDIQIDFTGVTERQDFEGGDYTFEVVTIQSDIGPKGPYLRLNLKFLDGKYEGLGTEEIVSLAEKAKWRVMQLLKAVGYEVPKGPFRFTIKDLTGLKFRAETKREIDPKYGARLRIEVFHGLDWVKAPAPEGGASSPAQAASSPGTNGDRQYPEVAPVAVPAASVAVSQQQAVPRASRPKLTV